MRDFWDQYVRAVIVGTLVGIAAHHLGNFIGLDAPLWAWAIIFCILWALSSLPSTIKVAALRICLSRGLFVRPTPPERQL